MLLHSARRLVLAVLMTSLIATASTASAATQRVVSANASGPAAKLTPVHKKSTTKRISKRNRCLHASGHKSCSNGTSSGSVALDTIGTVKKGKTNLHVTATVPSPGLTCELELTYADGTRDQPTAVTSDNHDTCDFTIDIPSQDGVLGQATAQLSVTDRTGTKKGSAKQTFSVALKGGPRGDPPDKPD